jgi:N-acetylglutamate synthase-like GNAT family acetyltransferase
MRERRLAAEEDQLGLLDLLRSTYDGWHSEEFLDWKFNRNPNGHPIVWIAEDKGKIVGCYILNPVRIRIGRVSVLGAQSVDAAVDVAYRGRGIFKKLAVNAIKQASMEGIAITYAFPTEIAYKGQISVGYQPAFIVPKMYNIFNLSPMAKSEYGESYFRMVSKILRLRERSARRGLHTASKKEPTVKEIGHFDSRFEIFWRRICEQNQNILVERNLDYLRWRYFGNPEQSYSVLVCEENNEIVGYSVSSVDRNIAEQKYLGVKLSVGNIVDLLTLPNKNYASLHLIARMLDWFECNDADLISCWMFKNHPYYAILRRFGFSEYYELLRRCVFRSKYVPQFILYVNSKAIVQKASESKTAAQLYWFIMLGDADFT